MGVAMARVASIAPNVTPWVRHLLEAQKAAGISDKEFASRAGYAYPLLSRWRKGHTDINARTLSDFAEVLGLELRLVDRE